jgi:hypothetical protein
MVAGTGIAAVCVALAVGVAPSAVAHGDRSAAHAAVLPGVWQQVSDGSVPADAAPAVYRYGNTLQVAWVKQTGVTSAVRTRMYNALTGAPEGGITTVISGWSSLNDQVALTTYNGQRMLVFAGIQNISDYPLTQFDQGTLYYALSSDGVNWTVQSGSISQDTDVLAAIGFSAIDDAGTPMTAFAVSPHSYVGIHRDVSASVPASTPDTTTASAPACCVYYPGLGLDTKSHAVWVAWYDNAHKKGWEGINAQQVYPAGAHVHAPLSSATSLGQQVSQDPEQTVQVAARAGGGLYTGYMTGYPSTTKVVVWKLGAANPTFTIPVHDGNVGLVSVSSSVGGRIWVSWVDPVTHRLQASRTNAAVTRIGAIRTLTLLKPAFTAGNSVGDGSTGALDLVATRSSGSSAISYFTRILPGLSGSVSKSRVAPRGGFVVTVTDAGAPVAGAAVHFGGSTKHTNAKGKVTFTVPAHAKKGRASVTFSHAGYAGGAVRVTVT